MYLLGIKLPTCLAVNMKTCLSHHYFFGNLLASVAVASITTNFGCFRLLLKGLFPVLEVRTASVRVSYC